MATVKQLIGILIFFAIAPAALADNVPAPVHNSCEIPMEAPVTPDAAVNSSINPVFIQAEINDQFIGTFLVDTGSDISAISASAAAKLQLVPKPYFRNGRPYLINGKQAKSVQISSFRMGRFVPDVYELIVLPDNDFSSLIGSGVDGLIGASAFAGYAVEFDFPQQKMVLWYPGVLSDADLKPAGFASADGLALGLESDSDRVYVAVKCLNLDQEKTENLEVDTGAGETIISKASAHELKLTPIGKGIKLNSANLGGYSVRSATVDSLDIGSFALQNQAIEYPDRDLAGFIPLLGRDILSQGVVLIDYPAMKMYIAAQP